MPIAFIGLGFVAEACDVVLDAGGIGGVDGQVGIDEPENELILIASGGFANDAGQFSFSYPPLDEQRDAFFVVIEDGMLVGWKMYGIEFLFCDVDASPATVRCLAR